MPGLADAFELVGDAIEHQLPQTHAAGMALAVTDREETLGAVVRGFADVAAQSPVRPETRFEIGSISKQFAAIVALQEVRAGTPRPPRVGERAAPMARAPGAVRPDHAASPAHAQRWAGDRHGGGADGPRRRVVAPRAAADVRTRGALLVLERRLQARRTRARTGHRQPHPRAASGAPPRAPRHAAQRSGDHRRDATRPRRRVRAAARRSPRASRSIRWSSRRGSCRTRPTARSCPPSSI